MSERRDSYDFLGWAPDLGFWDAPAEPTATNPPPRPVVTAPRPLPQLQARRPAPLRPAPPARQASASVPQRSARTSMSMAIVPLFVAFAAMCIITLMTALSMTSGDPESTPVPLLVCLAITTVLGFAWVAARR